jgi:hypothetical protein
MVLKSQSKPNGIVWKNNVNAHAGATPDGVMQFKRHCSVCKKEIGDFETVLYCFLGRGTQSANAIYVHKECEQSYVGTKISKRVKCRICEGGENLDGVLPLNYDRKIFYHRSCLSKIESETVPLEKVRESATKRVKNRIAKVKVEYVVGLDFPYEGLMLRQKGCANIDRYKDPHLNMCIRPIDGKLLWCLLEWQYARCFVFNEEGWILGLNEEDKDSFTFSINALGRIGFQKLPKDSIEVYKATIIDLQKHFDNAGQPIGPRLDIDFKIRFLLKHGCSLEGLLEGSLENIESQYENLSEKKGQS